ncbi:MAG TPA: FtsW/RodA/SpoVE family cell cycle protein [Planctomycetota bacterium]|nr:FtsW/RodA/SpoVE family cell cycle protein [Planctomycetota bacterium]
MSPPGPSPRALEPSGSVGALPRERQLTIFERLEGLARRAEARDPLRPAAALFAVVLALMGLGLLVQASHAATTLPPEEFLGALGEQAWFRFAGLCALLGAARLGPSGIRRFLPALILAMAILLVLVFVPPLGVEVNGSHRWIELGVRFQPSELARIVVVLWIADRCVRLGPLVRDVRRGVAPIFFVGLSFFLLIACETDLGGAILLLLCTFATMWVGGARPAHVAGTFTVVAGGALAAGFALIPYIRRRIEMFLGTQSNQQVADSLVAISHGGAFGQGLGQGVHRNLGVPYLESDFVFAQVGEELGLFGMLLVLALCCAFLWYSLQLVLSLRGRFDALASFGLLVSTALQAMLHVQVVAGLAPPKGMTLPFLSHGGTSLVVSCLGVGLALGAARRQEAG